MFCSWRTGLMFWNLDSNTKEIISPLWVSLFFPPAWPPPTLPNTSLVLCAGSRWQPYSEAESVRNRAMENRVASKLAFYSSGMAEASGGMNSSLIHIILSCIQPGICFLTHLSTVQPVEGGWAALNNQFHLSCSWIHTCCYELKICIPSNSYVMILTQPHYCLWRQGL